MRLVVTADLHYDIARSMAPARRVAEQICGLDADALLVLGDVGGRDPDIVRDGLHLFDRFKGRRFFVAGNHDIWTNPGEDSLDRLERVLPQICQDAGFHDLGLAPAEVDGVGLAGSIGWYDYSFRSEQLHIPLRFYEAKIAPGAASRLDEYAHLVADLSDVPEEALRIGTRWMDGEHVRLPMSDVDFCRRLVERADAHLRQLERICRTIIFGIHHLPFEELVPHQDHPGWAFGSAFLGSTRFGELLLRCPKVRYVFCGHSHREHRMRIGHIDCVDVGCTYISKRYEIVEV
ncbi:MAG TPA: metallophosphoesterase [Phycisphaerae bacterium]|nr:metallophosphoesterase [Phycisphaerae bacterium]HRR83534.1 metallophosphoesterase [Phycisphaerae bacterium]